MGLQKSGTTDKFTFYYQNKDHLGTVRETVTSTGAMKQRVNYYPFGGQLVDTLTVMMWNRDFQQYKYNGKEFDGTFGLNTYDYGARQHYPVLARWDRLDPLCEKNPGITPYHFCHNNPVNRVDPDGKDDYFNSSGAYMYSTPKGSNVYINNVLITNVPLTDGASRQSVANVVGYYANEVGISYYAKGGKSVGNSPSGTVGLANHSNESEKTLAFTRGNNILINKNGGKINSMLHDKYNIISSLEHEGEHKNARHGFKEKKVTNRDHASVYAKQIGSKTFSKTTKDYQNMVVDSFIGMLKKAIADDATDKDIISLINAANKGLKGTGIQIVFERTGGGTDSYDLDKKTR